MLRNVLRLSSELFENIGLAIGTIVPYYRENHQPENFLICDGRSCSGYELEDIMTHTPDLRGKFIRMIGGNAGVFGFTQEDAIRNITGEVFQLYGELEPITTHGCFQVTNDHTKYNNGSWVSGRFSGGFNFDASMVVPTAAENRPINVAMSFLIYAGKKKNRVIQNIIHIFASKTKEVFI